MSNSKFNPSYMELKQGLGRPHYLRSREVGWKDKMLIVRYRMGGELGTAQYWREIQREYAKYVGRKRNPCHMWWNSAER